jgi:SAM-dependent methyltransferase
MSIWEVVQILTLVFLVIIFSGVVYLWIDQMLFNARKHQIGYFPSMVPNLRKQILRLFEKYEIDPTQTSFVELGCGLGSVCFFAAKQLPFQKVIGVDLNVFLLMIARLWGRIKKRRVTLVLDDIYKYPIPKASFVYCYLGSTIMTDLYARDRFNGHFLISVTFPIKNIKPTEKIHIGGFYKRVYIYDLR